MTELSSFDGRIAVAGLALRAPGASTVKDFWANLLEGGVSGPLPNETTAEREFHPRQIEGFMEFDRHLFGMQPAEALLADPQQRVFLELVWEAFEDAGLDPRRFDGRIGVFAGCGRDDYRRHLLDGDRSYEATHGRQQIDIGNERDYFATNVAYRFDLKGPSFTIQSACSTSLVAIHNAVRSLLTGECDAAVAGGLMIQVPETSSYRPQEGGICSMDGRCRPFTADSAGTVPASGGGAVILVRAVDVETFGSNPYAHIVGSAANNDGGRKMNFAAPALSGQVAVIREALEFASLTPEQVGYVQAHGTGTRLGDEIEVTALRQTYGSPASLRDGAPCAVGSIKANVGHADAGAGVLGFITCALALREGIIPPTPSQPGDGAETLGPDEASRLTMPRSARRWTSEARRRAAVSSLGVGGTNAHVVLEEAQAPSRPDAAPAPALLTVSGATPLALHGVAQRLLATLDEGRPSLAAVASTLRYGRTQLDHRWAIGARSTAEAAEKLRALLADARSRSGPVAERSRLAVLLPGQGAMIGGAYAAFADISAPFRTEFEQLCRIIADVGGPDLRGYALLPPSDPRFGDTQFVQPLLFAMQLALLRSLRVEAAEPVLVVGHSLGEFVAAVFGGLLDDEAAVRAVVTRASLMAAAPDGAMVTVRASEDEAQRLSEAFDLDVAVRLSSSLVVLAGSREAAQALVDGSNDRNLAAVPLPVTKAFHSRMMASAASDFGDFLSSLTLKPPRVPVASNRDGSILPSTVATDPAYWGEQIRHGVDLRAAIDTLVALTPTAILDLGPGDGLTNLVRERTLRQEAAPRLCAFAPSRASASELSGLEALADAWCAGVDLELPIPRFPTERLPTYPFDPTRYWPEATRTADEGRASDAGESRPLAAPEATNGIGTNVLSAVHRIWSEAFGREDVVEEDDFFDVGGTSIHATQILSRINAECGVKIKLHDLYDYPVLREFGQLVQDRREAAAK